MIKLVAMDLDDTLLQDDWTLSERTVRTIQAARKLGVQMTLATGRMPISAKPYAEQLGMDIPVITYHGVITQQVLSGEILFRRPISQEIAEKIITDLTAAGAHCHIYAKNRVVTSELNQWSKDYARLASVDIEEQDLLSALAEEKEGIDKILIMGEPADLEHLKAELNNKFGEHVHMTKSKAFFLEVIDKNINKGIALANLARHFQVRREEVMAVGDSFNDLEMIEYAGVGVAMGNACPELKQIADFVTGTNREDGVAQAIEKYILG